jgi:peptidoglycan/LPS O-acetylase OafA/YrhL
LLIEFAFGILIAAIMMRVPSVPPGVCVAMIAIGFLELGLFGNRIAHDESNRLLVFGLPVVFIVAGIILLERQVGLPTIQIMKATGDASYSIYLTHTLLLSALAQIWRAELGTWPPALFVTGSIVGALVLGLLVNAYVERPMSNALAQRLIRRSPAQASPAGGSLARAEPR